MRRRAEMTRGRAAAGHAGEAGVTFIELIVVVAILAAVAALILPALGRGSAALRLRSEAGRVGALVRQARQEAVTHRQTTRVILDRASNTVALTDGAPDRQRRQVTMPPGVRLRVAAGSETISFSPRGLTRETRWIVEGPGGRRLAIDVEGVSGRVRVGPEPRS